MKIAVTGAAGHIGSEICRQLLQRGYEVAVLVHHDSEAVKSLPVTVVTGNILDKEAVKRLAGECDALIHSAGQIQLGYRYNQPQYDINVTGTKNVLEAAAAAGIKRTIYFSSVHAFEQKPADRPLDEKADFVSQKSVFYDQTKRDGHRLALQAARNGQDVVVVCPTSAVGPPDHRPSKIGKAIIDIYNGSIPAVVKGGFDFADVRDVANGAILALEKGRLGETYILGGKYHTIKSFADIVLESKGVKKRLAELPLFLADVGLPFVRSYAFLTRKQPLYDRVYLDILRDGNKQVVSDKAIDELGYSVRDLRETIADSIEWFKKFGKLE